MPIKSALKTSLLSIRFKDFWLFSQNLVFDKELFRHLIGRTQFIFMINHIYESHARAKIRLFCIFINPTSIEQTVHQWIEKSIEKGVKELDLDFDPALEPFKMPFRLMDMPALTTLKLTYCKVTRLPHDLKGLSSLKTLMLRKVVLMKIAIFD
ncbi:LRR domain containing protein [Trema orientale]|uniref:LRR domain containing protein n=1 Tax=Trema orientale TaxID=63057 RepID=A0A2P5DLL3_TREOI|nr:LRR domain containing protein [Trema orientale]